MTALVVVLLVSGGALFSVDTRPVEARARDWALSESARGRLPVTVEALAEVPLAYRRAAFLQMTAAQRSDLWREHYERFAATPGLSSEQRALVLEYRGLLTPAIYDLANPGREELAARTVAFCPRIQALFDEDQRWALKNIGPRPSSEGPSRLIAMARLLQRATGITTVMADEESDCRCSKDHGACDCNSGELCKTLPCTEIILHCGCGAAVVNCDRKCEIPMDED